MRARVAARIFACLAILIITPCASTRADDDDALPAYQILSCDGVCANSISAEHIDKPVPPYPGRDMGYMDTYVEGFVEIRYIVGVDGHVHDVSVLHLIGPHEFADNALDTIKTWTFKPATLDGHPVEQLRTVNFNFYMQGWSPGARKEIAEKYKKASFLVDDGKLDEALATLTEAQAMPRLNFYERGMIANFMALLAMQRKDYSEAKRLVDISIFFHSTELEPRVQISLWKIRIAADLQLGDIVDALGSLNGLKAVKSFDKNDPVVKTVDDVRAKIDALPAFTVSGQIPKAGDDKDWTLGLYRRTFGFSNVSGTLEKFTMSCKQQTITSPVTVAAEWHVPKNWSDCYLYVEGAPGTTFSLVESTNWVYRAARNRYDVFTSDGRMAAGLRKRRRGKSGLHEGHGDG